VRGGGEEIVDAPLAQIPVWVRAGSVIVTYPAEHVAGGLGDVPEGRAAGVLVRRAQNKNAKVAASHVRTAFYPRVSCTSPS
jgi:alpha-glucosidase (family GH31 glycosyl hydrolase)